MTTGGSNFGSGSDDVGSFPIVFASIPEEMLLAWIEGELSAADVSVLAQKHPQAVALVAAMRRDRAVLASAAIERAPVDLSDKVMATLERETLLGLSQGELVSDSLPISKVPKQRTARQIWWQKATPRLAMAAGVALIASVGAVVVLRGGPGKGAGPVGPIAALDPEADGVGDGSAGASLADARSMKGLGVDEGAAPAENGATALAMAPGPAVGAAVAGTIDAARAAQLAGEGRLVLRVRDVSAATAAKLATKLEAARSSREWTVRGELPAAALAMLAPEAMPGSSGTTSVHPSVDIGIAAAMGTGLGRDEPGPVSVNPLLAGAPVMGVWPTEPRNRGGVVDVRGDAGAIEAARAQLSKLLGHEVEFEEAVFPIVLEEPAATAESVLWWTRPPESWGVRVRVPLVVEVR